MKIIQSFLDKLAKSAKVRHAYSGSNTDASSPTSNSPTIVPREIHKINRKSISRNALKVLHRLNNVGFESYIVGGAVRDLLLDLHPKDFDVTTNALPDEVDDLFRNCRLIGRRFRLAHIHFGRDIVEVATFRGHHLDEHDDGVTSEHGMIIKDNVYGTIEEDAYRRDFTINALFYNIQDDTVIDYVGGLDDLLNRRLKLIGDPIKRYKEDPVRILRAIRFAAKLGLTIVPETEKPIKQLKHLLCNVPPARLFEEIKKLFATGHSLKTYELMLSYGLFAELFPLSAHYMQDHPTSTAHKLIRQTFANTDDRIAKGRHITPAFFLAALLWPCVQERMKHYLNQSLKTLPALFLAAEEIIAEQTQHVSIPKRFSITMKEIWAMQFKLNQRLGNRAYKMMEHPRFRAGYDFLLLRTQVGERHPALANWWTEFQECNEKTRKLMIQELKSQPKKRPKADNSESQQELLNK